MDRICEALKKAFLDLKWVLLIAAVGVISGAIIGSGDVKIIISIILAEITALPIAFIILFLLHLALK